MRWWLVVVMLVACSKADDAKDRVVDGARVVEARARAMFDTGKRVKRELEKVYKATHDYDISVDPVASNSEHDAKLAALPHVKVGDITVGYEESAARAVNGVAYAKHFRASWRHGDRIVRVSFYTHEQINIFEFVKMLERLVPIVERVL